VAAKSVTVIIASKLQCVSKNAPTLASCSFDKRGLILIIFGKRHQHTFENDTPVTICLVPLSSGSVANWQAYHKTSSTKQLKKTVEKMTSL